MVQKSLQINDVTQGQIDDLVRWGHGPHFSSIVRTAIDRIWMDEYQRREQSPAYERIDPTMYGAAWQLMDEEVCAALEPQADEMTMGEYFRAYAAKHLEKYGEVWELAKHNPVW